MYIQSAIYVRNVNSSDMIIFKFKVTPSTPPTNNGKAEWRYWEVYSIIKQRVEIMGTLYSGDSVFGWPGGGGGGGFEGNLLYIKY